MNSGVGRPRIGQWYSRWDKGEIFQVIGRDDRSRAIEIQTFDGDVDEIDADAWATLPLGFVEPPEDWTGPMDDVETDDLGYSETEMEPSDWEQPLESVRTMGAQEDQDREVSGEEPEEDVEGEGRSSEKFALEEAAARGRLR